MSEKEVAETITNPDALMKDENSMAFYVLKDEELALCKDRKQLPYHKNRTSYLSCGRYSPAEKVVMFWPESINPQRAFDLLVENGHISPDFKLMVSGSTTRIKKTAAKDPKHPGIGRHDAIRQSEIENLMKRGLQIQKPNQ